jgi:hypothetical protein
LLAFDSKDFLRRKIYQGLDPLTNAPYLVKEDSYYSPLGVGAQVTNNEEFKTKCLSTIAELSTEFQLPQKKLMYDSSYLRKALSHKIAIPFCDKLITKLKEYIEFIHITYVVMPPDKYPLVKVGGYKAPAYEIKSAEFLRNLQPMFSYLSAWSYFALPRTSNPEIILDGFSSKRTHAWNTLINKTKPKIFPHGDECNINIMIADIIAYLTDAKLYTQKKGLRKENIQEIWQPYGISVDSHYLDFFGVPQYGWHSEDQIGIAPYLARPMIFLIVDDLTKLQLRAQTETAPINPETGNESDDEPPEIVPKEEKSFRELIKQLEPWFNVTAYAYYKGGAAQLFNLQIDMPKVQDGDTIVYIGSKAKELAEGITHIQDVEVLSAKEVRKNVNRQKGNTLIH